ncbi:MAG TPA: hypothetical protein VD995_17470 [Azospirillum sp.]|nr:hypothetical protein [Azospirillum sp.]
MKAKHWVSMVLGATALTALASNAGADNLGKLQDFKSTGASLRIQTVDQDGARAAAIRENLKKVKLPAGFKIDLYAIVPDARHMAVGPNVGVVFVGTRKADV